MSSSLKVSRATRVRPIFRSTFRAGSAEFARLTATIPPTTAGLDKPFAAAAILLRHVRLERICGRVSESGDEWASALAVAVVHVDSATESKPSPEADPDAATEVSERGPALQEAMRYLAVTGARPLSSAELGKAGLGVLSALARAEATGSRTAVEVAAAADEAAFDHSLASAAPLSATSSIGMRRLETERRWLRSRALVAAASVSLSASVLSLPSPPPPPPGANGATTGPERAFAFAALAAERAAEALVEVTVAAGVGAEDVA